MLQHAWQCRVYTLTVSTRPSWWPDRIVVLTAGERIAAAPDVQSEELSEEPDAELPADGTGTQVLLPRLLLQRCSGTQFVQL